MANINDPAGMSPAGRIKSKVWLITGCSSGLGEVLAQTVLDRGDKVIATMRDLSRNTLPSSENLRALELDVTATQECLDQKVELAISYFGQIDVLVNNAGYVLSGVWEEVNQDSLQHQLDTNFLGPLRLTRAVLPHFRSRSCGSVLFMSSIAGWVGAAAGGPYSVSKFALEGAAECLQKEVAAFNIEVCLVVLGQFRTNILENDRRQREEIDASSVYAQILQDTESRHAATDGKQPGDPVAASRCIMDIVHGAGPAEYSHRLPLRLFLGSDCNAIVRQKCVDTLTLLDDLLHVSHQTDFQDVEALPRYQ